MYVVLSDTHIGDHHSNKNLPKLFSLLESFPKECSLILNGDVFDFAKFLGFDERHRKFLSIIQKFKEIIYIEGNHDWFLSGLSNIIPGVKFVKELILHIKNNIVRIFHGHQCDFICHRLPKLTRFIIKMNNWIEKVTGKDVQNWLWNTKFMKKMLKKQENKLIKREKIANIIIVGHTHCPEIKEENGITYYNTGDWISGNCAYITIDENIKFFKIP